MRNYLIDAKVLSALVCDSTTRFSTIQVSKINFYSPNSPAPFLPVRLDPWCQMPAPHTLNEHAHLSTMDRSNPQSQDSSDQRP